MTSRSFRKSTRGPASAARVVAKLTSWSQPVPTERDRYIHALGTILAEFRFGPLVTMLAPAGMPDKPISAFRDRALAAARAG
jgi:hypothetical protein